MGHVVFTVLGMVAQMERRFIKERQREGIERAKGEGRYVGGKRRIDQSAVLERKSAGENVAAIAAAMGCSRMQICRLLARADRCRFYQGNRFRLDQPGTRCVKETTAQLRYSAGTGILLAGLVSCRDSLFTRSPPTNGFRSCSIRSATSLP